MISNEDKKPKEIKYVNILKKLKKECSFTYTQGEASSTLLVNTEQGRGGVMADITRAINDLQNSLKQPATTIVWNEQKLYADGVLLYSSTPELTKSE
jgi:hypothetical protein